jgi:hypothetical protein
MRALVNCTLLVPPPATVSNTQLKSVFKPTLQNAPVSVSSNTTWEVRLIATNGKLTDSYNYLGLGPTAEMVESPSDFSNYVDLYFTNNGAGMYATDIRSSVTSGAKWLFDVATDVPGSVTITWDNTGAVPHLVLVDETTNETVDMSAVSSYQFQVTQAGKRSFHIEYRAD